MTVIFALQLCAKLLDTHHTYSFHYPREPWYKTKRLVWCGGGFLRPSPSWAELIISYQHIPSGWGIGEGLVNYSRPLPGRAVSERQRFSAPKATNTIGEMPTSGRMERNSVGFALAYTIKSPDHHGASNLQGSGHLAVE